MKTLQFKVISLTEQSFGTTTIKLVNEQLVESDFGSNTIKLTRYTSVKSDTVKVAEDDVVTIDLDKYNEVPKEITIEVDGEEKVITCTWLVRKRA